MKNKSRSAQQKKIRINKHLEQVNLYAAGIDVGSKSHFVAIPEGLDEVPVREFSCYTADLNRLADWLVETGIETVAMESTGIYWLPIYEMLEARGMQVLLVNARHVKNVTGRKSDVLDCQWIQQLHTYGLLSGAFRPPEEVAALRTYMRQRDSLVSYAGSHIQHMQKALRQMNILLDNVVSDITGKTGMKIIRAILAGERDPLKLAGYRDGRCQKSEQEIAKSLQGHYRDEHVFSLRQAVGLYDSYQDRILACDQAIEQQLKRCGTQTDLKPLDPSGAKRKTAGSLAFDVRQSLYQVSGVDLTTLNGISEVTALKLVSEIGIDMAPWKNEKCFSSWLGLSPGTQISGGKVLSRKTKPTANRAAAALRMAAFSLANSTSALGGYYRRMRAKHGAPKAITATAHKLAILVYRMLKYGTGYVDQGQDYYEERYQERVMRNLKRKANAMGYDLVPASFETIPA